MVIEAIQSGAKDFIVKPFQAERVLEAVKKVVGKFYQNIHGILTYRNNHIFLSNLKNLDILIF